MTGTALLGPAFRRDAAARVLNAALQAGKATALELARNEDYWAEIQRAFDTDRTLINLNNGGLCPSPVPVMEAMFRDFKWGNASPVNHQWAVLQPRIEAVRRELANEFGCDTDEIAITRNASESMENLILGIDLAKGDEVIVTDQNYGRMLTTWDQRVRREGIVVKSVSFPLPLNSVSQILDPIREAVTSRTRVIELPHITNLSGQILPIRDIVRFGKERGIEVFIDGAHSFAHFPFKRDELECDYFGTSLHKWLLAPVGTGMLYVRKEKQPKIWPLMAAAEKQNIDIRKFEEIGTHPIAIPNAIAVALAFHQAIGVERKVARLRYLRDRWAKPISEASPRFKVWTPLGDDAPSGAIGLVNIEGIEPGALTAHLLTKKQIVSTPINHPQFGGVRITPNIYTTTREIDVLTESLLEVLAKGV